MRKLGELGDQGELFLEMGDIFSQFILSGSHRLGIVTPLLELG